MGEVMHVQGQGYVGISVPSTLKKFKSVIKNTEK